MPSFIQSLVEKCWILSRIQKKEGSGIVRKKRPEAGWAPQGGFANLSHFSRNIPSSEKYFPLTGEAAHV